MTPCMEFAALQIRQQPSRLWCGLELAEGLDEQWLGISLQQYTDIPGVKGVILIMTL